MARWKTSLVVRIGLSPAYSKAVSVSARSPRRRVSSPRTPGAGMLPRLASGPEPGDEVGLQGGGRAPRTAGCSWRMPGREHVLDQPGPQRAVRAADAGPPALPGLQRDQRGAGLEVLADVVDPLARRQFGGAGRVLESDLGDHGEVVGELPYVARLLRVGQRDRPVRHLDVLAPVPSAEFPEIVEPVLQHELLEQRAAEVEPDAVLPRTSIFARCCRLPPRCPSRI